MREAVQVGAQGVLREERVPQTRREFGDPRSGVQRDTLEHIDEIGVGIDAVEATGDDQALNDADVAGTEFGPTEKP